MKGDSKNRESGNNPNRFWEVIDNGAPDGLTLPGKIFLEAEADDVIFLIVDGGRPIKFKK